MSTPQPFGFRMQPEDGVYCVYLIRADGRDIPKDKQRVVYANRNLGKAQSVSDALNSGLWTTIARVIAVSRMQDAQ